MDEYEWLVYSIKESGIFFKYCAISAKLLPKKRNLINQPKNKGWKDITTEFNKHSTSEIHRDSFVKAQNFISSYDNKSEPINLILDKNLQKVKLRTKNGLLSIVKTLQICARHNLPLRGHRDNKIIRFKEGIVDEIEDNFGIFNSLLIFRMDAGDLK